VLDFLELRKNSGKEERRARDLFTALWVPGLFMRRVEADAMWSLFDPAAVRGLTDCHGEEFDALYERFESTPGLVVKSVRAKHVWGAVLTSLVETGTPYILFKDAINAKSNQKHVGTIKSSNLCAGRRVRIFHDCKIWILVWKHDHIVDVHAET
jgi:ribonucleotide reductase alpha subunit